MRAPWHGSGLATYVASKTHHAETWKMWRDRGHNIISSWIDEAGPGETANMEELWCRIDHEVEICERLVLFAERDDFPLKGALVEVGMALAYGRPVYVVAPSVKLDEAMRPLGSWAKHPAVKFLPSLMDFFEGRPCTGS